MNCIVYVHTLQSLTKFAPRICLNCIVSPSLLGGAHGALQPQVYSPNIPNGATDVPYIHSPCTTPNGGCVINPCDHTFQISLPRVECVCQLYFLFGLPP
eukprot:NODE_3877_length_514_cov_80.075269_g3305_i0.p1 GENE.NODE_3877_length_514_cov_80.075269_g3305_i0~~NODE_3877_length_514_cov_80.075269_g3305_i0.p1  ORF type:complete len:99 (+),score=3.53 NODE_3877_length_514_cov_80.075269_g3305_i0:66-362(+)